jgi:glycosyltransferase involved in cell wall biosynthesis
MPETRYPLRHGDRRRSELTRLVDISVILPVYNTAPYLQRVIDALRRQDYPSDRYELIFVDNGSTDGSLELLRDQPDLRVLTEARRGAYAARNLGIAQAQGRILAFTDSDCFALPDWLSTIADEFENPRTSASSISMIAEYENRKAAYVSRSQDPSVYYGYTNNMAVRRAAMDRIGPFARLGRGSDTVFVRQVAETIGCDAVRYAPSMQVRHAEMQTVLGYYFKMMTYRRNRQVAGEIISVRTLKSTERWRLYREMARARGLMEAVWLMALLAGGAMAWWWGGRLPHPAPQTQDIRSST